jgi:hypothetical protein
MGRTMKRVPLDFSWPKNMIWKGYINPYRSQKCEPCAGSGLSPRAKEVSDQWYGNAPFDLVAYGAVPLQVDHPRIVEMATRNVANAPSCYGGGQRAIDSEAERLWRLFRGQWCHHLIQADVDALVEADRLWDFTRRPLNAEQRANCYVNGWTKEPNGYRPTAAEVNAWSIGGMGHDAINAGVCLEARCKREGIETSCGFCKGAGCIWQSPELEKLHADWQEFEPPVGEGYQLWETTSEGSPQSPVFKTIEELCAWCAGNATTFGDHKTSAAEWRRMLDADHVVHVEDRVDGGKNLFL